MRDDIIDEVDEQNLPALSTSYTSHYLVCGHPSHQQQRTVAMFSQPLTIPASTFTYAAFLLHAHQAGWRHDDRRGCWLCPACAKAEGKG